MRVVLTVLAVVFASLLGGLIAVWSFSAQRTLSAGTVSLSVSPFHRGALDAYVPVIDWGVRFGGVRAPARLQVRVSSVDRDQVARVARDGIGAAHALQAEARDAIVSYVVLLAAVAAGAAIALGALVAFALRGRAPRLALAAGRQRRRGGGLGARRRGAAGSARVAVESHVLRARK